MERCRNELVCRKREAASDGGMVEFGGGKRKQVQLRKRRCLLDHEGAIRAFHCQIFFLTFFFCFFFPQFVCFNIHVHFHHQLIDTCSFPGRLFFFLLIFQRTWLFRFFFLLSFSSFFVCLLVLIQCILLNLVFLFFFSFFFFSERTHRLHRHSHTKYVCVLCC